MRLAPPIRNRALLAAALAVVAAVLFLLGRSATPGDADRALMVRNELRPVHILLDSLLREYGVARVNVRSWQVQTPDRRFLRTERRITVPPEFVSVRFNRDLNRALEGTGTRAVATERTRENTVTMHIKDGSTIIESITFVVDRKVKRKE